jgi:hypothetical protein
VLRSAENAVLNARLYRTESEWLRVPLSTQDCRWPRYVAKFDRWQHASLHHVGCEHPCRRAAWLKASVASEACRGAGSNALLACNDKGRGARLLWMLLSRLPLTWALPRPISQGSARRFRSAECPFSGEVAHPRFSLRSWPYTGSRVAADGHFLVATNTR